jgi:REP element-mobilizing transposase RayT
MFLVPYSPFIARPLRIENPGAWYHVMNRGAGRKRNFNSDCHYELFLALLEEVTGRFGAEIHTYCLMNNHLTQDLTP